MVFCFGFVVVAVAVVCYASFSVFDSGLAWSYGSHHESKREVHKQAKDEKGEQEELGSLPYYQATKQSEHHTGLF